MRVGIRASLNVSSYPAETLVPWFRSKVTCGKGCEGFSHYAQAPRLHPGDASRRRGQVMPRWRVDILRKKAEHLGIVTAPNAMEALSRAATLYRIDPSRYGKLMITKVDEING
jgi:hypothetical protein